MPWGTISGNLEMETNNIILKAFDDQPFPERGHLSDISDYF